METITFNYLTIIVAAVASFVLAGFAAFKNHVSFGPCVMLQNKNREMLEKTVT